MTNDECETMSDEVKTASLSFAVPRSLSLAMNPHILYVEDTADTRELVEYGLQQDGFHVTTAETADYFRERMNDER